MLRLANPDDLSLIKEFLEKHPDTLIAESPLEMAETIVLDETEGGEIVGVGGIRTLKNISIISLLRAQPPGPLLDALVGYAKDKDHERVHVTLNEGPGMPIFEDKYFEYYPAFNAVGLYLMIRELKS